MKKQICLNGVPLFWQDGTPVVIGDNYNVYVTYDYTNTGYGIFRYPYALDIMEDKIIPWTDRSATGWGEPDTRQHKDGRYYAVLNHLIFHGDNPWDYGEEVASAFKKLYAATGTHVFTTVDI